MAEQNLSLGVLQVFSNDLAEMNHVLARIHTLIDQLTAATGLAHSYMLVPQLSAEDISLQPPQDGALFYNTTLGTYQGRQGGVTVTFTAT